MSDSNIPQTPEAVAYQLMKDILQSRDKVMDNKGGTALRHPLQYATTEDILDTYKECFSIMK